MLKGSSWGGFARHLVPDAEGGRRFPVSKAKRTKAPYLTGASALVRPQSDSLLVTESTFCPACIPRLARRLFSGGSCNYQPDLAFRECIDGLYLERLPCG